MASRARLALHGGLIIVSESVWARIDGKDVMIALSEVEKGYDFAPALLAFFHLTAKLLKGIGQMNEARHDR